MLYRLPGGSSCINNNFTFFRTIESLYEELVHEGILVRAPKTRLKEYAGEYRYISLHCDVVAEPPKLVFKI